MGWAAIIGLIIEAIIKGPQLIEAIKKWLELIRKTPKTQLAAERRKMGKALRFEIARLDRAAAANLAGTPVGVSEDVPCAVTACVADLEQTVAAVA